MQNTMINQLVVSKQCSLSPDKDSDDSKTFTVELLIDGVTVHDMALGLLKTEVIRWQNTNRPKFDKLVNRSIHRITFKKPIGMIDPETAMVEKLKAMTAEEQSDYIASLLTKVQ